MEITIIIEKHCIETEARRLYEKLLGQYFGKSVSDQKKAALESQIKAILFFLENADFRELRHRHSELDRTSKSQVVLDIDTVEKNVRIHCQGKEMAVPFINNYKLEAISSRSFDPDPEN
jgi:hypothetical protein